MRKAGQFPEPFFLSNPTDSDDLRRVLHRHGGVPGRCLQLTRIDAFLTG